MCAVEVANEGVSPLSALKSPAMTFCSVCLDAVVEGEGRSTARLTCGHYFHLDCIGSSFNAKGRMQCPNCRSVEQGRWLYANACCVKEDLVEESEQDTEAHNEWLNHTPWCPHQGLYEHVSLTFEELMNFGHGYAESLQSALHGRRICPYLVGVPNVPRHSHHTENQMASLYNFDRSLSHSGPWGASHVPQPRSAPLGHNGSSGSSFRSLARTGQMNNMRARHGEVSTTSTGHSHSYHIRNAQISDHVHGHSSWASRYTPPQRPSMAPYLDGVRWGAVGPHISYGVPVYWWAWAPFETNHRNMASISSRGRQLASL